MTQPHAIIIDDRPDNAGVLAELLTLENVSHTEIFDPLKLEAVLQKTPRVDVFFVDLEMPGMDGFSVLDMLRNDPRFQNVPVVAYTVHNSEINVAFEQGFHSFLGKPLDADSFPDQLARILRGERIWSAM
ncbi:MAG TPA: response regulator [Phototrophicaceae bacterium]|nr:response regulator [Phototrophicaceae bacterium]